MNENNQQVILSSRPQGWLNEDNFAIVNAPIPEPGTRQLLVRNHYISVDPYMRGRMNEGKSYVAPIGLGEVIGASTVGEVVKSNDATFKVGDKVTGFLGWQLFAVADATQLRRVDAREPLSVSLGVLGMPGVTAWVGLVEICQPRAGDTLVVTAAAGAVGSVVGQLAKSRGLRVVGVAGGAEKCRHVVEKLGFDACVNYKAGTLSADIEAATGQGIDCLFENVGGEIFDTLLPRMNPFGRVAVCGLISQYNNAPWPLNNFGSVLTSRLKMEGFIIADRRQRWPEAFKELSELYDSGQLIHSETVSEGLHSAPKALLDLFKGQNVGKRLVKLI